MRECTYNSGIDFLMISPIDCQGFTIGILPVPRERLCWHCRLDQCCHLLGCNFLLFVILRPAGQIFKSGWCSEHRHRLKHLLVPIEALPDTSQLLLDMRPSERTCQSIVCSVRYTVLTCIDKLLQYPSREAAAMLDQTPLEWMV